MIRKIIIVIVGLTLLNLYSKQISKQEIINASNNWMSYINENKVINKIKNIEEISFKRKVVSYLISYENYGFIIISNDDLITPIIAYSKTAKNVLLNQNIAFGLFIKEKNKEIDYIINNQIKNLKAQKQWKHLLENDFSYFSKNKGVSIGPLLTTKWNQSKNTFWSGYCPTNTYAGCTAVAYGQVLRYNMYKGYGKSSHGGINFANQYYDWIYMPGLFSDYYDGISDEIERDEVGKFLYHCGVACNMNYSSTGSGASLKDAFEAMYKYFNFKDNVCLYGERNALQNDRLWFNLINSHLNSGFPIVYAGFNNNSGHAFVIDGLEDFNMSNKYFHINWGWGGTYDGFFHIEDLTPGSHSFKKRHLMIRAWPGVRTEDYNEISGIVGKGYHKAHNEISTKLNTDVVLSGGKKIRFLAGEKIVLKAGFKIEAGVDFIGQINSEVGNMINKK